MMQVNVQGVDMIGMTVRFLGGELGHVVNAAFDSFGVETFGRAGRVYIFPCDRFVLRVMPGSNGNKIVMLVMLPI